MRGITATILSTLLGSSSAITTSASASNTGPISKVVALLESMAENLEAQRVEDEATYKKMMCWINSNTEKSEAIIRDTDATVKEKSAFIEKGEGQTTTLKQERDSLNTEKDDKMKERDEARVHSKVQKEDSNASILELTKNVKALDGALRALGAGKAFNQQEVMAVLTAAESRHPDQTTQARHLLASMLQTKADHFDSYENQGGQVIGVLSQMKDQMSQDLTDEQQQLKDQTAAFDNLIATLSKEVTTLDESYKAKVANLAQLSKDVSDAKADLNGAGDKLKAAQEFLADVEEKHKVTEADYAQRTQDRAQEQSAVADTIKILDNDDAFAARQNTKHLASDESLDVFLQLRSVRRSTTPVQRAAGLLNKVPSLSFLATQVQASEGAFDRVFQAMDQLVEQLEREQQNEVAERDRCLAETAFNKKARAENNVNQEHNAAQTEKASESIQKHSEKVEQSNNEIKDQQESVQTLTNARNSENADYVKAHLEIEDTLHVLKQAIERLSKTYQNTELLQEDKKKEIEDIRFIQIKAHDADDDAPPAGFNKYETGRGNIALTKLQEISEELKNSLADENKSEQDSQTTYEKDVKGANNLVEKEIKSRDTSLGTVATAKATKAELEGDKSHLKDELTTLIEVHETLDDECAPLIGEQFDVTQNARRQEIDAIKEAERILRGQQDVE